MTLSTARLFLRSSLSRAGVACLLVSFGAACGGSGDVGSADAGGSTHGDSSLHGDGTADVMDGGNREDSPQAEDSASTEDSGSLADSGSAGDSGISADTATAEDSATSADTGTAEDSGHPMDTGSAADTGTLADSGTVEDSASRPDSGTITDTGSGRDASDAADSGASEDSGNPVLTPPVDLGTAGNYVILSKTGISTVPPSAVTGNLGVSPAAATYITGFSLIASPSNVFSTSTQVTGMVYAADYATPTPSNLTTAIGDMQTAFTNAAGRPASVTGLGAGNIGGMTLPPGVYEWGSALLIPSNITLSGSATDVWVFQIGQTLTLSNAVNISLVGGALAQNVFWQVSGLVNVGTTAHFEGILMGQTSITLGTGASVNGRLLSQTAVVLDANMVVQP